MIMCAKCKKNPAMVFVSTSISSEARGYCLACAESLRLPVNPVISQLTDKFGISKEQFTAMSAQMSELMESGAMDDLGEMIAEWVPEVGEGEDGFEPGGAATLPIESFMNTPPSAVSGAPSPNSFTGDGQANTKKEPKPKPAKGHKHLGQYCSDLTKKARAGKLDRIVGRDKEIARVIQILSRRSKNNPCLIGEPGVGKTAIAEGLAQLIVAGQVPFRLREKSIFLLDLTALVAGTQFRGQFESRIKNLVDEVKQDGNVILFIDEVHNLVGTGDAEGSMNAANILKPSLSRGEIQVIGATTFNEYRKHIEKDTALERRFQPVVIAEPSVGESLDVLRGIKGYYEEYHKVQISDHMLIRIVTLSERYINDRFLPDKAIDLMDEACASASLRNQRYTKYLETNAKLTDLEKQKETLSGESDLNYEALANLNSEILRLEEEQSALSEKMAKKPAAVGEEDLARVIELWTGIPASKIQESEHDRLVSLEKTLESRIKGQPEAVRIVANAVRRSRVQLTPRRHPASFIFVGPTGVGKTELVKVLSQELFDTPETLIRLDMAEFMEKHSVARVIGSPPGYVGYDEAGQLTEKVRRRPYSVILLDEIEKAHPDVLNVFLQILDEGKITDAHGRDVNFENTIIVMTSNAGSEKKDGLMGFGRTAIQANKDKMIAALSEFLRPEFLSRVGEVVVFAPLTSENYLDITEMLLEEYISSLKEHGISFDYDKLASQWLAQKAFNLQKGAREIRNLLRREVEDRIALEMVSNRGADIKHIRMYMDGENLCILFEK